MLWRLFIGGESFENGRCGGGAGKGRQLRVPYIDMIGLCKA